MEDGQLEQIFKKAQADKARVSQEAKPTVDSAECSWPVAHYICLLGG